MSLIWPDHSREHHIIKRTQRFFFYLISYFSFCSTEGNTLHSLDIHKSYWWMGNILWWQYYHLLECVKLKSYEANSGFSFLHRNCKNRSECCNIFGLILKHLCWVFRIIKLYCRWCFALYYIYNCQETVHPN